MIYSKIIVLFAILATVNYAEVFKPAWNEAGDFLMEQEKVIEHELGKGDSAHFVMAIAFPELLRYRMFKDLLETRALELIYVNYGKEAADFSIGPLQMKPSFAEKIEHVADSLGVAGSLQIDNPTAKEQRKIRIERLSSFKWQLRYLKVFSLITARLHSRMFFSRQDKLRFFSAAYNHDFMAPSKEISSWSKRCIFPYGVHYKAEQYCYADIAVYYYRQKSNPVELP